MANGRDERGFLDHLREALGLDDDRSGRSDRGSERGGTTLRRGVDYDDDGRGGYSGEDRGYRTDGANRARGRDTVELGGGADGDTYGYSAKRGAHMHDPHYQEWRTRQIEALDRDYHEYREHHQGKFENEFSSFRDRRQTQRSSLSQVHEHMEVVGSDGGHIGTVDKLRGDRIVLTCKDPNAGGHHHSIPSIWIESVTDKVAINKTADEAMHVWRDEDAQRGDMQGGTSGGGMPRTSPNMGTEPGEGDHSHDRGTNLNSSFSGTY